MTSAGEADTNELKAACLTAATRAPLVPPPPSSATPAPPRSSEGLSSLPGRDPLAERTARLFEEHHREVLRFLRRRDPDLAEDALSETFAVAVRRAADIPVGRELPWLYVVAEHVLRNLQRSRRRAARVPEALHPFTVHTTQAPDVPTVGEALGELPDRERLLLTMTAFEGLSATEAADRMGIPYGSARNALSSGRRRLAIMLAAAAAVVLVVGLVGELADRARRQPLEVLASSLSQARIVHDVALVSHDEAAPATRNARDAAAAPVGRYERWSEGSGSRTRVRLPGGTEVVAQRGETLRAAARDQVDATGAPARRRAVREDLTALDATSPDAIAALLADPIAQQTAADGPTIDGHDTTTVRGRIADAAGAAHDVQVFVADDEPTVVRVRVRTATGAGAAATPPATVDFVAWTAVPRRAPAPTTPVAPRAAAPETTTPVPPAGGGNADTSDRAEAPARGRATATAESGTTGNVTPQALTAPQRVSPAAPRGTERAELASAPIVHVRQAVRSCVAPGTSSESCTDYGDREVWFEQSGQQRSRSRTRRRTGALRNEEWVSGSVRNYFTVSADGSRIRGLRQRQGDGTARRAQLPPEWRAAWLNQLAPQIAALRASPARVAELPAGPDVGGHSTKLFVTEQSSSSEAGTLTWSTVPYTVDVAVDPSSGAPRRITFRREPDGGARDVVTLEIATWEQFPAGLNARLVSRRFPKGASVRSYD